MASPGDIKVALERNVKAVSLRPSVGQGTAVTKCSMGADLRCSIEEGAWKLNAGMTEKYGGDGSAPNPGVLGRAALASCLAIGYAMWAARLDIPFTALDVEVHADYDVRGELAAEESVRPGYVAMRYVVTVAAPVSEDRIREWLDTADRYSSWRDNIANPVPLTRELRITQAV